MSRPSCTGGNNGRMMTITQDWRQEQHEQRWYKLETINRQGNGAKQHQEHYRPSRFVNRMANITEKEKDTESVCKTETETTQVRSVEDFPRRRWEEHLRIAHQGKESNRHMKKHHPQSTNVSSMTANIEQRSFLRKLTMKEAGENPRNQKPPKNLVKKKNTKGP